MLRNTVLFPIATACALAAALSAYATVPSLTVPNATVLNGLVVSEQQNSRPASVVFSSCEHPVWPTGALASQRFGTVTILFDVDTQGKVVGSAIAGSSGHGDLDEAARIGISKCTFNPGIQNGKPVRSTISMKYVWTT
jgi:bla regulator protein BlaR1